MSFELTMLVGAAAECQGPVIMLKGAAANDRFQYEYSFLMSGSLQLVSCGVSCDTLAAVAPVIRSSDPMTTA